MEHKYTREVQKIVTRVKKKIEHKILCFQKTWKCSKFQNLIIPVNIIEFFTKDHLQCYPHTVCCAI